jgi:hypothetical protein
MKWLANKLNILEEDLDLIIGIVLFLSLIILGLFASVTY